MTLNYTGVPFDFDLPALLALQGGPITVLSQKQPHFISGASVSSAGTQDGKLDHPAGVIPKPLYGENVVSFQLTG
jgi:type III secretion apparatus